LMEADAKFSADSRI